MFSSNGCVFEPVDLVRMARATLDYSQFILVCLGYCTDYYCIGNVVNGNQITSIGFA